MYSMDIQLTNGARGLLVGLGLRDFQQYGSVTCVDLDEPVQPPAKLRNFKCCSVRSLTVVE